MREACREHWEGGRAGAGGNGCMGVHGCASVCGVCRMSVSCVFTRVCHVCVHVYVHTGGVCHVYMVTCGMCHVYMHVCEHCARVSCAHVWDVSCVHAEARISQPPSSPSPHPRREAALARDLPRQLGHRVPGAVPRGERVQQRAVPTGDAHLHVPAAGPERVQRGLPELRGARLDRAGDHGGSGAGG